MSVAQEISAFKGRAKSNENLKSKPNTRAMMSWKYILNKTAPKRKTCPARILRKEYAFSRCNGVKEK